MPEGCSFRFVEEKHASGVVEYMVWSPKMDLIAVANNQGETLLYRLIWQKVWTLAAPEDEVKVRALAWRPDGKVLAVGYSNGQTTLCDVENAERLHVIQNRSPITSMSWIAERAINNTDPGSQSASSIQNKESFQDTSSFYLPKLPQFSKSYSTLSESLHDENVEDSKRLKDQIDLNILAVGTEGHCVSLYAYGVFPVAYIDLHKICDFKSGRVLSCQMSHDLYLLSLLVEFEKEENSSAKDIYLISLDTTLIACRHRELRHLALKFGQVLTLLVYLESTIQQMVDSWEDILLEIDSKLMKLAEDKYKACGGSVSNDFLRLLMLGRASEELTQFLLMELTEKGLKKLGHSIEASYSNIQKLVLKHLQSVGQALVLHLSDIRGMSQWFDKFGVLGLSTSMAQDMVQMAGSFMLKASELQQVIDTSMRNFRAFFRWLYVVIQRLSEEPVSPEFSKMTQQDLDFVAQFLKDNFIEIQDASENYKKGYRLEKVGQYLHDDDLVDLPDMSGNPWLKFLQLNPLLQKSDLLYKAQHNKSLIQVHTMLKKSINASLAKCADVMSASMECVTKIPLFEAFTRDDAKQTSYRISQYSKSLDGNTCLYTMFTTEPFPCSKLYMLKQLTTGERCLQAISIRFGEIGSGISDSNTSTRCDRHTIHDLSFYDDNMYCTLLQEHTEQGCSLLVQAPLSFPSDAPDFIVIQSESCYVVKLSNIPCVDAGPSVVDQCGYRRLENMKGIQFAVSGARRVACVLFSTRRRVRLFMMDAEDEEDEDDDEDENEAAGEYQTRDSMTINGQMMDDSDENKENAEVSL